MKKDKDFIRQREIDIQTFAGRVLVALISAQQENWFLSDEAAIESAFTLATKMVDQCTERSRELAARLTLDKG